jgi:hypothetical protein
MGAGVKGGPLVVDTSTVDGPIQRDGAWWQRANGSWHRWNAQAYQWEAQGGGPPPPSSPQVGVVPRPTGGGVAVAPSRPATTQSFDETWATVRIQPDAVEWSPSLGSPRSTVSWSRKLVWPLAVVGLVLLAVALYFNFMRSNAPSGEEIDAAFGSLRGFEYQAVPENLIEQVKESIGQIPEAADLVVDVDARMVLEQGQPAGAVLIMGVDPDDMTGVEGFTAEEQFFAGFESGFQQGAGVTPEQAGFSLQKVRRAGTRMYEVTSPMASAATFLDEQDGFVFIVTTRTSDSMRAISRQLARRNL